LVARVGRTAFVVAAAVAAVASADARPPLELRFDTPLARPGDRVTVSAARNPSWSRTTRIYLLPAGAAGNVRSRLDPRLQFVGLLRLRRVGRSSFTFTVPPLDSGSYFVAFSRGRTVTVLRGAAPRARLQIMSPTATTGACPVTIPNGDVPRRVPAGDWTFHGNHLLAAALPSTGAYLDDDGDGSVSVKMIWIATGVSEALRVRYGRIDVPAKPLTAQTGRGTLVGYSGPSWASRLHFTEGCWKVTGRVEDVGLSFVLSVTRPRPEGA
jgi:hypothetical protein